MAGTAVVATTRYRGAGTLKDALEVMSIDEQVGLLNNTDRAAITKLLGGLTLPAVGATFEQMQYFFAMAFGGPTTGAADGAGTDKVYTTNIPTTAAPTAVTYTVEGGDDFEVEKMEYCVATKIHLAGAAGGILMVDGELLGRQVQRLGAAFTATTIPTVEDIVASKGKLYLDPIGSAYGTTQITNQILGIDVTYTISWIPKFTMDGNLYYTFPMYATHKVEGKVTFEHDAAIGGSGAGEKVNWRANTKRSLRVDYSGSAVVTGGTTYQARHLILDFPVTWKVIDPIGDQQGNDIVTANFFSKNNLVKGDSGKAIVVNELATLP